MSQSMNSHPDLLRRFAPILYTFDIILGRERALIQSNDLELALRMRRLCMPRFREMRLVPGLCKLIRDADAPGSFQRVVVIGAGSLRTLHMGIGTTLIYDRERSELLGFLASDVSAEKIVTSLIPALMDYEVESR
jgi:hypothetical protein